MADGIPIPAGATVGSAIPHGATVGQPAAAPSAGVIPDPGDPQESGLRANPLGEGTLGAGVVKGALRTGTGLAKLLNKILPASFQIPVAEEQEMETHGVKEGIGDLAENVGEFALGDEALKGLANLTKLPEGVIALVEKYPKAAKIILGMVKSATLGAVQGAAKGAATDQMKEGAEGGAMGGAFGEATGGIAEHLMGPATKAALQKVGLWTTAEEDAMRAFKPARRNVDFMESWKQAAPLLRNEIAEGGKFENIGQAVERIDDIRNRLWDEKIRPAVNRHADEQFSRQQVRLAVLDKITPEMRRHAPEEAKTLEDFSKRFTSASTIESGEKELEFINAQLRASGFYKLTPAERSALLKTNGQVAGRLAAADGLREAIYDHLEDAGEQGIRETKQLFGALRNVGDSLRNQVNVAGRQQPVSLKQIVGLAGGLGPTSAALIDKMYNAPEAILNRAVAKTAPPSAARMAVTGAIGAAGRGIRRAVPAVGAVGGRMAGTEVPMSYPEAEALLAGGRGQ